MPLDDVDVVLVRPSRPANVAAACRALKNMGLRRLLLVGTVEGLDRPEVRGLAYGAWDVLDGAAPAADLRAAVAGCTLVAGTSGRAVPGSWTPRRLAREAGALARGGRIALVFGPEATGLTNLELSLCHVRVHIPSDPAQPSLNLAQAVLILAYEARLSAWAPPEPEPPPGSMAEETGPSDGLFPEDARLRATAGELETALDELKRGLLGIGYLNPDNPHAILGELRALLLRATPSPREVALLRGLARQIRWAAAHIARGGESSR